jgi:vacuole morphology and inheritance protein 14
MSTPQIETLISPMVVRLLSDRSFEKRRQGATEIEKLAKQFQSNKETDSIKRLISSLISDFLLSTNPNLRKGGLIGLASCAISLGSTTIAPYLVTVIPAITKSFNDVDPRIRYYAAESLFNITKIARISILPYFSEIFTNLCKLISDVDPDVKNGAGLLDRLLKEIITEDVKVLLENISTTIIPLLSSNMQIENAYVRALLLGWIITLDKIPGVDMLIYLSSLLDGLFNMLEDGNREIRQQAYSALEDFLHQISSLSGPSPSGPGNQLSKSASLQEPASNSSSSSTASDAISSTTSLSNSSPALDLVSLIQIVLKHIQPHHDRFSRITALEWLASLLVFSKTSEKNILLLSRFLATLCSNILSCLSDPENEIVAQATKCNLALMQLVRITPISLHVHQKVLSSYEAASYKFEEVVSLAPSIIVQASSDFDPLVLLHNIAVEITSKEKVTRMTSLKWIIMLLNNQCTLYVLSSETIDALLACLLTNLVDSTDVEVLKLNLEVIARVSVYGSDLCFLKTVVLRELIRLFGNNRSLLESRGTFIIRRLCLLLDPQVIYVSIADLLGKETNKEFVALLVELLTLTLFTSPETSGLREMIRSCLSEEVMQEEEGTSFDEAKEKNAEAIAVFSCLYQTWTTNPIATFTLCLLAEDYSLARKIISFFAENTITLGVLMQADKLVQLLESPIFLTTRLHLVQPHRKHYQDLVCALYGLLMVLPQGNAYNNLKDRLTSVTPLSITHNLDPLKPANGGEKSKQNSSTNSATSSKNSYGNLFDSSQAFQLFVSKQNTLKRSLTNELKSKSVLLKHRQK